MCALRHFERPSGSLHQPSQSFQHRQVIGKIVESLTAACNRRFAISLLGYALGQLCCRVPLSNLFFIKSAAHPSHTYKFCFVHECFATVVFYLLIHIYALLATLTSSLLVMETPHDARIRLPGFGMPITASSSHQSFPSALHGDDDFE